MRKSMDTWVSALVEKSCTYSKAMLEGTIRLDSLVIEQSRITLIQLSQTCVLLPPTSLLKSISCAGPASESPRERMRPCLHRKNKVASSFSYIALYIFLASPWKKLATPAEIFLILWPWDANAQEICLLLRFPSPFCKASMFQRRFKGTINQLHLYLTLP